MRTRAISAARLDLRRRSHVCRLAPKKRRPRAEAWLALIDIRGTPRAGPESSSMFRSRVAQTEVDGYVEEVREPLGAVTSRKLLKRQRSRNLYRRAGWRLIAVLKFQSSFAHKASAVETVTLVMDAGVLRSVRLLY